MTNQILKAAAIATLFASAMASVASAQSVDRSQMFQKSTSNGMLEFTQPSVYHEMPEEEEEPVLMYLPSQRGWSNINQTRPDFPRYTPKPEQTPTGRDGISTLAALAHLQAVDASSDLNEIGGSTKKPPKKKPKKRR